MPLDKAPYGYLTLRYVHDVVTGEFANIGVVLFAPQQGFLKSRFLPAFDRLDAFFLHTDHAHLLAITDHLKIRFSELSAELRNADEVLPITRVKELAERVMPRDDSSIQWSEMSGGFSNDPGATLHHLFARLVEHYAKTNESLA